MVDIESQIFTRIYDAVHQQFPECNIVGTEVREIPSFPCVSIEETDNTTNPYTIDSSGECHSIVEYEINVFTSDNTGKRAKCKRILSVVDSVMTGLNFIRTSSHPSYLNYDEIYRYVVRYTATVSKNNIIYRR